MANSYKLKNIRFSEAELLSFDLDRHQIASNVEIANFYKRHENFKSKIVIRPLGSITLDSYFDSRNHNWFKNNRWMITHFKEMKEIKRVAYIELIAVEWRHFYGPKLDSETIIGDDKPLPKKYNDFFYNMLKSFD